MVMSALKFHEIANRFPLLEAQDPEEWEAFVDSIRRNGQREPIVLHDGKILDGRNRYQACRKLGIDPVTIELDKDENPWEYVWDENAHRRHLAAGQKVALYISFQRGSESWASSRAKREADKHGKQVAGGKKGGEIGGRGKKKGLGSCDPEPFQGPKPQPNRERDDVAKGAGVSPSTAKRALALESSDPDLFKKVVDGEVELAKACGESKLKKKRALTEKIRANPIVTPDGRYQVIVSDPPWKYDARSEDTTHRGKNLYPEMTVPEICALPVASLAQDNCLLWLWTTNAFMRGAYECLDAWGFKEKTILTWDKENFGLGDWLRNVTEHCILAVRGRPLVSLTNQTTLIREKRREHSRKPEAFYALVEQLCPGSKLEMFSRTPRDGWSSWGAETTKFAGSVAAE